jgi:hypothetical protein
MLAIYSSKEPLLLGQGPTGSSQKHWFFTQLVLKTTKVYIF